MSSLCEVPSGVHCRLNFGGPGQRTSIVIDKPHVVCSSGRQTPWPKKRCAIAHAIPVARLFAMSAFGPLHPPFTVSWKTCNHRSNTSGVNAELLCIC